MTGQARTRARGSMAGRAACLAAATLVVGVLPGSPPRAQPPVSPAGGAPGTTALPDCHRCNVLLISVDTVRADHLSTYGYERDTSPHLDRLARRSLLFERAHSSSYVTADSHMSVFTALDPSVHGVRNAAPGERTALRLHDGIPTLPEVLQRAGYRTAGFTGGGNIGAVYGFDRGMDHFASPTSERAALRSAERFIRRPSAEPYFLFFHTYHAHDPYTPGRSAYSRYARPYRGRIVHSPTELAARRRDATFADFRRAFWEFVDKSDPADVAHLRSLYDAELRETDAQIGRLIRAARREHRNTLVIVLSDHGEQFGEHGSFLHNDLYQELIHVPLVISHPAGNPGRFGSPASLLDLAPTILDVVGLAPLPGAQGRSLRGMVDGIDPVRDVHAEKAGQRSALIRGNQKVILGRPGEAPQARARLFDLASDPGEQRPNSVDDHPLLQALLQRRAFDAHLHDSIRREAAVSTAVEIDDATAQRLRALGYAE